MASISGSVAITYIDDDAQSYTIDSTWTVASVTETGKARVDVLDGVRRSILGAAVPPAVAGKGEIDDIALIVVVNRGANPVIIHVAVTGGDVAYFPLLQGQPMLFHGQGIDVSTVDGSVVVPLTLIDDVGAQGNGGTSVVEVAIYSDIV